MKKLLTFLILTSSLRAELTDFDKAICSGNLTEVTSLLNDGKAIYTGSPIICALLSGHYHVATNLIEMDIGLEVNDKYGCSPLKKAINLLRPDIVIALINKLPQSISDEQYIEVIRKAYNRVTPLKKTAPLKYNARYSKIVQIIEAFELNEDFIQGLNENLRLKTRENLKARRRQKATNSPSALLSISGPFPHPLRGPKNLKRGDSETKFLRDICKKDYRSYGDKLEGLNKHHTREREDRKWRLSQL